MERKQAHYYYHQPSGKTVAMRAVALEQDLACLHQWTHQEHVIPNWQLNKPITDLYKHFYKALRNKHQSLFIISIDGIELCYAETYYAPQDRLANFCDVQAGDFGLHLFIGPQEALGKGYSELILCALTDYLFTRQHAARVLVEPNQKVEQLTILQRKLGYHILGSVKLPEKTATLYAVEAADFYSLYPHVPGPAPTEHNKIHCDISEWPLVRIHFPDHPQDEDVRHWLQEIDGILSQRQLCVAICTFAEHYQFTTSARRYQALWFKNNIELLAASCLAMVRVTRDQDMIAKITSNAMRQGMPFICIPAHSVKEAEYIAQRLLHKANITRQN